MSRSTKLISYDPYYKAKQSGHGLSTGLVSAMNKIEELEAIKAKVLVNRSCCNCCNIECTDEKKEEINSNFEFCVDHVNDELGTYSKIYRKPAFHQIRK